MDNPRQELLKFAAAINSRDKALRRDECGDWRIKGERGHIYAVPEGFQLCFYARNGVTEWDGDGPHIEDYNKAKRDLFFCRLAQDGTGEGIFFLDRAPTPDEGRIIREVFVIEKKRETGEPSEAQMAARAAFASRSRTNAQKTRPTENAQSQDEEGSYP